MCGLESERDKLNFDAPNYQTLDDYTDAINGSLKNKVLITLTELRTLKVTAQMFNCRYAY